MFKTNFKRQRVILVTKCASYFVSLIMMCSNSGYQRGTRDRRDSARAMI